MRSDTIALHHALQDQIKRSPFLSWLGLQVVRVDTDEVEIKAPWRAEWIADPEIGQTQGGILAALIDFTADAALFAQLGRLVPTIDLRIDYYRLAGKGDLQVTGHVVKQGRSISFCEAKVLDGSGTLLASGRGTFYVASGS